MRMSLFKGKHLFFIILFLLFYYKMPKPNSSFTLIEIKSYVRSHNLNKPEIKLSMNKSQLVAGLKKHGHWDHKSDARKALKTGGAKPPMVKRKTQKQKADARKALKTGGAKPPMVKKKKKTKAKPETTSLSGFYKGNVWQGPAGWHNVPR
jgi:hypothetical protein